MNQDGKALRGIRRMQKDRMIGRARRIVKSWNDSNLKPGHLDHAADHLALCSCRGCGNRRRYEGRDLDELRHLDSMQAGLAEARE